MIQLGLIAAAVLLVVILFFAGYKKAPADVAHIRSGLRKSKTFIGKAYFCIPFFERFDTLELETIAVDIKTSNPVPTADCIPIDIDAVCVIQVNTAEETILQTTDESGNIVEEKLNSIELAKKNFLNKDKDDIEAKITQTLEGNIREIVARMELKEMLNDRKKFGTLVNENVGEDLARMGISVVSFNVQNFTDQNNVIEALGVDNTERIRKEAAISRAVSSKEIKMAEACARKEAKDAEIAAEKEIAEKNTELAIRQAELKRQADTEKAKADSAFEIQNQEQQKVISVARTNAEIAKQEREIELKAREAEVREKELLATVQKQADAELYQKQKLYEADTYKAQQEALAQRAQADAKLYEKEKEAEGIALVGKAEAEAIAAKGLAEAEALEKKAEAQAKMGQASMLEMYFRTLPEVAQAVAAPLENVGNITMYGDGNSTKMVGDITKSMTQIMSGIEDATGLNVSAILNGVVGAEVLDKFKSKASSTSELSSSSMNDLSIEE